VDDAALLRAWRNDPDVRAVSATTHEIAAAEHRAWLDAVLADDDRELLIAERDGRPVGTVRFDREGAEAEVSISVAAEWRGGGTGTRTLREATELELAAHPELERVVARVRAGNERSARAFERAGYALADRSDGWLILTAAR
jgi:RimJ/RimL family protein N-acetyltransferase